MKSLRKIFTGNGRKENYVTIHPIGEMIPSIVKAIFLQPKSGTIAQWDVKEIKSIMHPETARYAT